MTLFGKSRSLSPFSVENLSELGSGANADKMVLSPNLITKLLGAIQANSLVFLCGAGLSMSSPSNLPSSQRISQTCYDAWLPREETLDPDLRNKVDLLAECFHARDDLEVFLSLVPWDYLVGPPNKGHASIADLLIARAACAALSANFDPMIEQWANERRVAMQGALTGWEANEFAATSSPLIKFHGCLQRDRKNTLWAKGQLDDPIVKERIGSCSQWMNLNLPGKDLVVVGFWTDWVYLNDVLANAFEISNARSVTVIDPSPAAELQDKAPTLWAKLTNLSAVFQHVQGSGDEALDELRTAYSKCWVRKFYALGALLVASGGGAGSPGPTPDTLEGDALYNLRRDAEGVPYDIAARRKEPGLDAGQAALAHLILLNAGAIQHGAWWKYGDKSIRIVNGAGQGLTQVKEKYKEPPIDPQADIVVCAGSIDLGVPAKLISSGRGASTIRPSSGGTAIWLTLEQAKMELSI